MRKTVLLIVFSLFIIADKAQTPQLDSLKLVLKSEKKDTTQCNILALLIGLEPDDKIWSVYNDQLKTKCEVFLQKNPDHPLKKFYLKRLAEALNNFGYLANNQGNIPRAIEYYAKSLKIKEELGNKKGIATSLLNLGAIFHSQGEHSKAEEYYRKSLKIQEEMKDKNGIAISLNNLGLVSQHQGNISEAIEYYEKSLKIQEELGNKQGIARALSNLGAIYHDQNNLSKAMEYLSQGLKIQEEINDKRGIAFSLNNLAYVIAKTGDHKKAIVFAEKGLKLSQELGFPENIRNAAKFLFETHNSLGHHKDALENHLLFIKMRDSISNMETRKASIRSQLKYEYEKKAAADSVRVVEEKKVTDAQLKQEKTQRYALYGGLTLVGLFSLFMFNRFRVTNRQKKIIEEQKEIVETQKHLVEEKQKEILDSITYARRIQRALVTNEKYIQKNLEKLRKTI
jgi:tetratricopeptide (TPR) repeat protein